MAAYEVKMYFQSYYSGETTDYMIYSKVFADIKDANEKFRSLSKNVVDIELWKKMRSRVRGLKAPEPSPKDFEDGYAEFESSINDKVTYFCERTLDLAYGFDYETLQVYIADPETGLPLVRSPQ